MKNVFIVLLLVAFFAVSAHANLIINGDFEDNTASQTEYNLYHAEFNSTVANATAFGGANEIELATGTDWGLRAQSGQWKLGLHKKSDSSLKIDAFSFDLSVPIVSGNTYTLQFFAAGKNGSGPIGPVEVGLSNDPEAFGTQIFTGTPTSTTVWTQFDHVFVAPENAMYLTVRNATSPQEMYAFVDNFSIVPEPMTICLLGLGGLILRRRK
jgi:hypothetical protein